VKEGEVERERGKEGEREREREGGKEGEREAICRRNYISCHF